MRILGGQKAYEKTLNSFLIKRDKLVRRYERGINKIINEIEKQIVFDIKNVRLAEWEIHQARKLIEKLNGTMAGMETKIVGELRGNMDEMFGITLDSMDGAYARFGLKLPKYGLSPDILEGERLLINSLIKDFSTTQSQQLGTILNLGIQGGKSTLEVSKEIRDKFGVVQSRANKISRTEMLRVQSMTQYKRDQQIEKLNPQVRKVWKSTHKPDARTSHIDAEVRYADGIKMNEYFEIEGERGLFPRDAGFSAKNTVFCSCYHQLIEG